jgi:hypothetical protein
MGTTVQQFTNRCFNLSEIDPQVLGGNYAGDGGIPQRHFPKLICDELSMEESEPVHDEPALN